MHRMYPRNNDLAKLTTHAQKLMLDGKLLIQLNSLALLLFFLLLLLCVVHSKVNRKLLTAIDVDNANLNSTWQKMQKKCEKKNNNEIVWTRQPLWYVLIACIVRYVLLMSETKFMLCTRRRNDTPVSMYVHIISHKCSLFQAAAASTTHTHTDKSNRSWHDDACEHTETKENSNNNNKHTDARIFSQTRPSSYTIIIRINSIGVYESYSPLYSNRNDYFDTNNDDEWIAEKAVLFTTWNRCLFFAMRAVSRIFHSTIRFIASMHLRVDFVVVALAGCIGMA